MCSKLSLKINQKQFKSFQKSPKKLLRFSVLFHVPTVQSVYTGKVAIATPVAILATVLPIVPGFGAILQNATVLVPAFSAAVFGVSYVCNLYFHVQSFCNFQVLAIFKV